MSESHTGDIGYQIQQIAHYIKQLQNESLMQEDLSISHVNVMYALYEEDGVTQSHIQKKLGIKASSLSKLIDILIRKGYVTRESVEHDGRTKVICLTESGKQKKKKLNEITNTIESQLKMHLSKEEGESLSTLLHQVKVNIQSPR